MKLPAINPLKLRKTLWTMFSIDVLVAGSGSFLLVDDHFIFGSLFLFTSMIGSFFLALAIDNFIRPVADMTDLVTDLTKNPEKILELFTGLLREGS